MYRDIDALVASGVSIEGERGVGYLLREPVLLPPLTLAEDELEALHFALDTARRAGDPSERVIRPLRLEWWGAVWTLTGWCETRGDFRVFHVDRIGDCDVGEPFAAEPGRTYADYLARMRQASDGG